MRRLLALIVVTGCPYVGAPAYQTIRDQDGDGVVGLRFDGPDCDDTNPQINPQAQEVWYDGIDQNCDGRDDDQDGDGFPLAVDCDDTDPRLHPDVTYFIDQDGDGFGGPLPVIACEVPPHAVADDSDCDDTNAAVSPIASERCDPFDRNCDGDAEANAVDAMATFLDGDGDGFGDQPGPTVCSLQEGLSVSGGDCDDTNPLARPGVLGSVEVCDGFDNDCDGLTDDADLDVDLSTGHTSFEDLDGDGYGSPSTATTTCVVPAGRVMLGGDCNDAAATLSPAAEERCDGVDNDCDTRVDVGAVDALLFYVDADGDGAGSAVSVLSCDASPPGVAATDDDCDDTNPAIRPGALEICGDGLLQDCNATLDDCDGDGTPDATDCRPANPAIHPGAAEACDGLDNDCDGLVDAADPDAPPDVVDYFLDADGDGFGSNVLVASAQACTAPAGGVTNTADCDDADDQAYPGRPERCDGVDNDCNNAIDDGQPTDPPTYYRDLDEDGFGVQGQPYALTCAAPSPTWADQPGDCDDNNASRNPGVPELCDGGIDNDCDGLVDLNDPDAQLSIYYFDGDGDGFGDLDVQLSECFLPAGYADNGDDCDDTDPLVSIGEADAYPDADGDGFPLATAPTPFCGTLPPSYLAFSGTAAELEAIADCDDANAQIAPGELERCDSVDNDCDGLVDDLDTGGPLVGAFTIYLDLDGDGLFGTPGQQCNPPSPDQSSATDCDDTNPLEGAPTRWFLDADLDGFGDPNTSLVLCEAPTSWVADSADCNDADDLVQSATRPLIVPWELSLDEALAAACDGQTIELFDDVPLTTTLLDRPVATTLHGNGHTVSLTSPLQLTTGELHLEDLILRGTTLHGGLDVDGDAVATLRDSRLEDFTLALSIGPTAYTDLLRVAVSALDDAVRVDGALTVQDGTFEGGIRGLHVRSGGLAYGSDVNSTAPSPLVLGDDSTAEFFALSPTGQNVAQLGSNATLLLHQSQLSDVSEGFLVGANSRIQLDQSVAYDIDGALFTLGPNARVDVQYTTLITGTDPWFTPADGALLLEDSILAGHAASAAVALTMVTQANTAVHPFVAAGTLTSNFGDADEAHEFDESAFFRFAETGCVNSAAYFDLHPLANGPFADASGASTAGWTAGPDNPEAGWSAVFDGLPAGFRGRFGYTGSASGDEDADGLTAVEELVFGTDPTSTDTNFIGMPDLSAATSPTECAYAF